MMKLLMKFSASCLRVLLGLALVCAGPLARAGTSTLSAPTAAIVQAINNLSPSVKLILAESYTTVNGNQSTSVGWTEPGLYTGTLVISPQALTQWAWLSWFNGECKSGIDCEGWGENTPAIDAWNQFEQGYTAGTMYYASSPSTPTAYCWASSGVIREYALINYQSSTSPVVPIYKGLYRAGPAASWNSTSFPWFYSQGEAVDYIITKQRLDCPKPTISNWIAGTYARVSTSSGVAGVAHNSVVSESSMIIVEAVADHFRKYGGQLYMPSGLSLTPQPNYAQTGSTDTDGDGIPDGSDTCPSDPTNDCTGTSPPPSEPPTDEDDYGSCSIIDIPCNLRRLFIPVHAAENP